ncbi:unnamed protein product [Brassica rapa]|uniref:Uncharacterized protein n=1 Tax=Brassica campestris TaxID=3711 RepID=A0A8D9HMN9_BRACM|nr:unnamed protein product [Brassica rapa]
MLNLTTSGQSLKVLRNFQIISLIELMHCKKKFEMLCHLHHLKETKKNMRNNLK